MSRSFEFLQADFRQLVEEVLIRCSKKGIEMVPFFVIRDPWIQARLWRQSRTTEEIVQMIQHLKAKNANFLVEVIKSVGPQYGNWATDCPPGFSWHQWGEAVDCFVKIDGGAIWDGSHAFYTYYATEANSFGLTSLAPNDICHVQYNKSPVVKFKTCEEISAAMKLRFKSNF